MTNPVQISWALKIYESSNKLAVSLCIWNVNIKFALKNIKNLNMKLAKISEIFI